MEDTRHPANKEAFRPEDLRRARDEAKSEVDRYLRAYIAHTTESVHGSCVTLVVVFLCLFFIADVVM